jgi:hypothetical protein
MLILSRIDSFDEKLIMTGDKIKGKRPVATPAYIADWWRDGTAVIETGMATVGRRSGTINTRDAVGVKKKAELSEPGPKHPNR